MKEVAKGQKSARVRRVWQREQRAQNAQVASSQDQVEEEDEGEGDQRRLPGAGHGQRVDERALARLEAMADEVPVADQVEIRGWESLSILI